MTDPKDPNDVSVEEMLAEIGRATIRQDIASRMVHRDPFHSEACNLAARRLDAARDYILAAHAILGPPCPKCGHFLKAEHQHQGSRRAVARFNCTHDIEEHTWCACNITDTELLSDYPEIAKEMGLS